MLGAAGELKGRRVLELGSGNGLCSLAALQLGAARVLATDYRELPLALARRAAKEMGQSLETQVFDIASPMPSPLVMSRRNRVDHIEAPDQELPEHDVLIAADVGYSTALAWRLGERCREALGRGCRVLVAESRKMADCRLAFHEALNLHKQEGEERLRLQPQSYHEAVGPGARVTEDVPTIWFLDAGG